MKYFLHVRSLWKVEEGNKSGRSMPGDLKKAYSALSFLFTVSLSFVYYCISYYKDRIQTFEGH